MELKVEVGLSKSTEKLIEVVAQGFGRVGHVWLTGPQAKANVAALKAYEVAGYLPEKIEIGADGTIKGLSLIVEEREAKRLKNVAGVVEVAQRELPAEVPNTPVDPDWSSRFFSYVPDVTSEQMQELWGKVLAGEVSRPGAFSVHTLDVLRNLSRQNAELFTQLAAVHINGAIIASGPPSVRPKKGSPPTFTAFATAWSERITRYLDSKGLTYGTLLKLSEAGLVFEPDAARVLQVGTNAKNEYRATLSISANRVILLTAPDPALTLVLPATPFTSAGTELLQVCTVERIDEFDSMVVDLLASLGFKTDRLVITNPGQGQTDMQGVAAAPSPEPDA
jgi:hypothetical protein